MSDESQREISEDIVRMREKQPEFFNRIQGPLFDAGGAEKGKERVNNVADVVGQLTQRWEQSISPTNRRLNERFAAGEIHVLLLVREAIKSEVGKIWVVGWVFR